MPSTNRAAVQQLVLAYLTKHKHLSVEQILLSAERFSWELDAATDEIARACKRIINKRDK